MWKTLYSGQNLHDNIMITVTCLQTRNAEQIHNNAA